MPKLPFLTTALTLIIFVAVGTLSIATPASADPSGHTSIRASITEALHWVFGIEVAHADVTTGLVGHYPFDGNAQDSSGQGNHGTAVNNPTYTTGKLSQALNFDGANDRVSLNTLDITGSALTLTAWINADNLSNCSSGDCRIISKATGVNEPDHYWMLSTISSSGIKPRFRLKTNGTTHTLIGTTVLSNATWYHLTATYDGSMMRLYVNGQAAGSIAKTGTLDTNATVQTWIGDNPPTEGSRPWNGKLDDVRIYNRALSQSDITELYNYSGTPQCADTLDNDGDGLIDYPNDPGCTSASDADELDPDTTAPTQPTNPSATAQSENHINLSWSASTDPTITGAETTGVSTYRIRQCTGATCTPTTILTTSNSTSYSDTGLSANTTYRYTIAALDGAGNESVQSTITQATTLAPDTTPPSTPTNLSATTQSSSQINLSWSASTDNVGVTGYRVERCQGVSCSNFTQVATPTGTTHNDTGLTANTTHRYRVRAVDAAGNLSTYTSVVSAITQSAPLTRRMVLQGLPQSPDQGTFDGTSVPTNGDGDPYPNFYSGVGPGTVSINVNDAISGNSFAGQLNDGYAQIQFNPYNGSYRGFAREYVRDPGDWQFDTYNRMRFWIKVPPNQAPEAGANHNYEIGTYVKNVTRSNPTSDEDGGGHAYHHLNIPYTGTWVQVIMNAHPNHWRGANGNTEHGLDLYPTGEDGQYNYFDALTRFYVNNVPRATYEPTYPAIFLLDEFEFYKEPFVENDQQVYSLIGTYVSSANRVYVGWMRDKNENNINHEVRYAFSNIHEIGWSSATLAPNGIIVPQGYQGYNGMWYDTTQIDVTNEPTIYIAIKPQNSNLFSQIAIPTGQSAAAQCSDSLDNDVDGLTDYPADPGCTSSSDNDETDSSTLVGDLNNDGTVNSLDWGIMNAAWFTADATSDLNSDGLVNSLDFGLMNSNWGSSS